MRAGSVVLSDMWVVLAMILVAVLSVGSIASANETIVVDGQAGGKQFDGVGAVSGGGATSVLLKDYPEPQRSQILDILFKPQFAASMQTLYVEIGGDGNSTQGTEPTHMRSRDDENYQRGYEWWLMVEAKRRNPALTLDACAWGCPGWIGNGNFWSQDMCDYYVKWIKGLKTHYGLDLDAIGCRNERGSITQWVKQFRKTLNDNGLNNLRIHAFDNPGNKHMWDWIPQLDSDPDLAAAVDIVGNHCLTDVPMPTAVRDTISRLRKPIWNTEQHIYNEGSRTYKDEFACALGAVHQFNSNFIELGATKIVNWYLCGSTYSIEPYYRQPPAMFASSPWSGHYEIKPIIWSYAHYGQFSKVGWQYVSGACGNLSGGGTYVTLKSPDNDYSIIIETADASAKQSITFNIKGGISERNLCVWRSNHLEMFVRQTDIAPNDGSFTVDVEPNSIYSVSTTTGQQKGEFPDVPPEKPFPFPYYETFDHYSDPSRWGYLPHYTADICGVFEIVDRPDGHGQCLRQALTSKAQSWAPEWKPYTVLGDRNWKDYEISADVYLVKDGWGGVIGRVNSTGNGWDGNPNGYYFRLDANGDCSLYIANQRIKGSRDQELAKGMVPDLSTDQWHNVKLRFRGSTITAWVDQAQVLSTVNGEFRSGMAGLIAGGEGNVRNAVMFDDLIINRIDAAKPTATTFVQDSHPIYSPEGNVAVDKAAP